MISSKVISISEAVKLVPNGAMLAVNSSSGLCCPDALLRALGERFETESQPKGITSIHPIAAGDMFGVKGIDHIAKEGLLTCIIGGSYPSGPSSIDSPSIWRMIGTEKLAAYNLPSGVIFDMLREGAGKRPGVLTKVGLHTFVDPELEGGAMNQLARHKQRVKKIEFEGEEWLFYPALEPDVAFIRATTADEKGNLTFEQEGAVLGAMEMALAAHNNGGKVIAQVKRVAKNGSLPTRDVKVPGILIDAVVEVPEQLQTTATSYDPAISGELFRPLHSFSIPELGLIKVIARRVAMELKAGWSVNIGFGVCANVPRILIEEGLHQKITWVIEQGAVGGVPLLDFKFGCSANAEAFIDAPHQFSYFQSSGFDAALLSFLEIDRQGSVNVSRLKSTPHRTAGAGGFIDITARARKIVFSGNFNVGAKISIRDGKLCIDKEGTISKLVDKVDQVSFSGKRAIEQGQEVSYVTERCVIQLTPDGLEITEVAPGIDLQKDILDLLPIPMLVSKNIKIMDGAIFRNQTMNLLLPQN